MRDRLLKARRTPFFLLLALTLALFFFRLGDRSFRNPDEGRYAQIAANMTRSHDWLQPRLFAIDYLRKPPLFYWLVAASFKLFGEGEWAARAVPAFFGLAGVLAAYFFSRRFFGERAGIFGALLLLTNPWYLQTGRFLVIDSVFSFFVVTSLYLFYSAMHSTGRRKFLCNAGFYICSALAFLAKGVLAVMIPGLAIFFYMFFSKQWLKILKEMNLFSGGVLFLVLVSPWFIWMSRHNPDFWNVFFVREHLSRFTAENFEHQEAWYFYLVLMTLFFLPWIALPGPLRLFGQKTFKDRTENPGYFLILSSAVTVFFLSLSKSKLATYLLPAIPQVCIVLGAAWAQWTESSVSRMKIFYSFLALMAALALSVVFIMESRNNEFTTKTFALRLKAQLRPGDAVFVYDHPGPFYDFPFYLGHPVRPVGLEGEFEICRNDKNARAVSVTREEFRSLLKNKTLLYCLIRNSDWGDLPESTRASLKVLMQDSRKTLFQSGDDYKSGAIAS